MTAALIARSILIIAEDVTKGALTIEEGSELNRYLWDLARDRGVAIEVDALLQATAEAEMQAAINAGGR